MTFKYDATGITKQELVLAVINQLGFLKLKADGDYLDDNEFLTLGRNVMILTDVLVRYTTAARKGKETADGIVQELRNAKVRNEGFRINKALLAGIDWLSEYVQDKIEDFTAVQFAESCIRADTIVKNGVGKKSKVLVGKDEHHDHH